MSDEKLIMPREEMLKKLDDGEDPLDISIEKWERLIKWMKLNPDEYPDSQWYHASTCALCEVHHVMYCDDSYSTCVLDKVDCCYDKNSTWEQFDDEPSIENAHKMCDVLKSVKE